MPSTITAYRVLIELAEELAEERQAFGDVLHEFNAAEALPRDVLFIPVGWDPVVEPSQRLLREDFRKVDYFLLVLWDRWPPGSEQEHELATECLQDPQMPMREVAPFFKTVSQRQLRDPGEELKKLLQFRQRVESERNIRFDMFNSVDEFKQRLRRRLTHWLVDRERERQSPAAVASHASDPLIDTASVDAQWPRPPSLDDPDGLNHFGLTIQREGMWKEAEELHLRSLRLADESGRQHSAAVALGHLGVIYQMQNELDEAKSAFHRALHLFESLGEDKGMAAACNGLGIVYLAVNDVDKAEAIFRRALDIELKLGRAQGKVACWQNLASVADARGDAATASEFRQRAQLLREEPQYPFGLLFPNDI